ncbi:MAG: decaprenyl-phosphate phosphoribosyltransferase, partial [Candidatus Krumholzibacteria bacterium]|nr:decaprenyl-phosphate phosphoribosyltransferase [Candidatus Krumholzibacteria bacterium]
LRPRQWTKNLLQFAGIIFARKLGESGCLWRAVAGAVVFCLASGVIYVFNDIADRDLDRIHPTKQNRPIPSGRFPVAVAVRLGLGLLVFCLLAAWALGEMFLLGVCFFFLWNWLYTRWLKQVPVLDVMGIGMSFVIRATAGILVILPSCPGVEISIWLLLCTFFLSLFLGFCKRRDELLKIEQKVGETRPVLRAYSEPMLNSLIGGSFALTCMMYALYTVWPHTVEQFGTRNLIYTLPFVLLGMGRYLYLVFLEDKGGRPHEILLMDFRLQIIVVAWVITAVKIIGI